MSLSLFLSSLFTSWISAQFAMALKILTSMCRPPLYENQHSPSVLFVTNWQSPLAAGFLTISDQLFIFKEAFFKTDQLEWNWMKLHVITFYMNMFSGKIAMFCNKSLKREWTLNIKNLMQWINKFHNKFKIKRDAISYNWWKTNYRITG